MIHLLDNYILDARTRYEGHRLIYAPENEEPLEFGGILAAAILAALLVDTPEGDAREIALDTAADRNTFFTRYEREVRRDNGGLFVTELQTLKDAYLEFTAEPETLAYICHNDRLYDLAIGLVVEYMQRLVREEICEQIYDVVPWERPFAQWLFNAGYVETRRQYLLSVDWTDPETVYAVSDQITNPQSSFINAYPTFTFGILSADEVLNGYWKWLWESVQLEANAYPDAKVRLAEYKQNILKEETNYDSLKPEMKDFTPDQLNLFRQWMAKWTEFVTAKIKPPVSTQKKDTRQELFLDNVQDIPPEHNYVKVREYILERCRYDKEFEKYFKAHKRTDLCIQLTHLFGWYVDPNALGKRMNSKAKK